MLKLSLFYKAFKRYAQFVTHSDGIGVDREGGRNKALGSMLLKPIFDDVRACIR